MKINKTNVALLDKAKIAYELIPYEVDEKDLSAVHVAASLGEDIEQVFKTLILHGDRTGYFVCVIPGEHEVDLKLAAKVSGNKKCDLIPMKELLPLIYSWRLFAYRHEKSFSYLYSRNLPAVPLYLYKCGATWPAAQTQSGRSDKRSSCPSLHPV
jgi:hypothetical protein